MLLSSAGSLKMEVTSWGKRLVRYVGCRCHTCSEFSTYSSPAQNFSHGATSSSSPYGPVENPYGKGFTTGGSSSGCGGLIGSGVADMGIGGDQGGSIRIVRHSYFVNQLIWLIGQYSQLLSAVSLV